jgi:hypothetical protein
MAKLSEHIGDFCEKHSKSSLAFIAVPLLLISFGVGMRVRHVLDDNPKTTTASEHIQIPAGTAIVECKGGKQDGIADAHSFTSDARLKWEKGKTGTKYVGFKHIPDVRKFCTGETDGAHMIRLYANTDPV